MKDEMNGMILEEFVGLRPKCYSLLCRGFVKDNVIQDADYHHSRSLLYFERCKKGSKEDSPSTRTL